jgi:hypothetical protein
MPSTARRNAFARRKARRLRAYNIAITTRFRRFFDFFSNFGPFSSRKAADLSSRRRYASNETLRDPVLGRFAKLTNFTPVGIVRSSDGCVQAPATVNRTDCRRRVSQQRAVHPVSQYLVSRKIGIMLINPLVQDQFLWSLQG